MKMESKKRFRKIVSLMLAAIMMVSVFSVSVPQTAEAATPSLKGSGSSSVKITDSNCYGMTKKANYIKFKSNVTGYVTLKFSNNSRIMNAWGHVTFCNSKKKALGVREFFNTASSNSAIKMRTYGVKKGSTYMIKVESEGGVKVSASVVSVKKSAGASRGKAKSLGKNKTVKGVMIAGSKAGDWYKIKLTKKQKLHISYSVKTNGLTQNGYCTGGIKFTLYKSNGTKFTNDFDYANLATPKNGSIYCLRNRYTGAETGLNPGTYYIKVEPHRASSSYKTSSGYYTLKWK